LNSPRANRAITSRCGRMIWRRSCTSPFTPSTLWVQGTTLVPTSKEGTMSALGIA
jgi:hypothetical protein